MRLNILPLAFLISLSFGCNRSQKNSQTQRTDAFTLAVATEKLQLPLDTLTSSNINSFKYLDDSNRLVFFNISTQTLYFYDLASKNIIKTLSLKLDGPNGTGESVPGISYHNADSILIQTPFSRRILLMDSKGIIKDKFLIDPFLNKANNNKFAAEKAAFVSLFYPANEPVIIDANLYLSGEQNSSWKQNIDKAGVLIKYNIPAHQEEYLSAYPQVYTKKEWGLNYRQVFRAFNRKNNTFIYSFPADPNLYVLDLKGNILHTIDGSSKLSTGKLAPYTGKRNLAESNQDAEFYFSNDAYIYIIYDPYHDLYYRIFRQAIPGFSPEKFPDSLPLSVVILDKDFNIVGETKLDDEAYYWNKFFVSPEGLNMLSNQNEHEDVLEFITLVPAKK